MRMKSLMRCMKIARKEVDPSSLEKGKDEMKEGKDGMKEMEAGVLVTQIILILYDMKVTDTKKGLTSYLLPTQKAVVTVK